MKPKKINTVPNGTAIVATVVFEFFLTLLLGITLLPAVEAMGLFVFSLLFVVMFIYYLTHKHWNFIEVSENGIRHGKDSYSWDNVYITVKYSKPNFARNSFDYYAFFDNHYLTQEESESKLIKRKGFYIILTRKRTKWLLSFYRKKINILDEAPYQRNKDVITQIKSHNLKFGITE